MELGGVPVEVKIAQFRLCHSRKPYCVGYSRESLEMVLDAHVRAFKFFGDVCKRGIYDNLKTEVTKVLLGKDRVFNRRFQNLASHYLFDAVACTPAAGWEKGQVENQVGVVRKRFFVKRRRFPDLAELNEWLEQECRHHAATARHPERKERTIDKVFAEEKGHLLTLPGSPFDGYQESVARVSSQLLVSFDRNRYSVNAIAAGKTVACGPTPTASSWCSTTRLSPCTGATSAVTRSSTTLGITLPCWSRSRVPCETAPRLKGGTCRRLCWR